MRLCVITAVCEPLMRYPVTVSFGYYWQQCYSDSMSVVVEPSLSACSLMWQSESLSHLDPTARSIAVILATVVWPPIFSTSCLLGCNHLEFLGGCGLRVFGADRWNWWNSVLKHLRLTTLVLFIFGFKNSFFSEHDKGFGVDMLYKPKLYKIFFRSIFWLIDTDVNGVWSIRQIFPVGRGGR